MWNQLTQTHAQEPRPIHTPPHPAHHDNPTRPPPGCRQEPPAKHPHTNAHKQQTQPQNHDHPTGHLTQTPGTGGGATRSRHDQKSPPAAAQFGKGPIRLTKPPPPKMARKISGRRPLKFWPPMRAFTAAPQRPPTNTEKKARTMLTTQPCRAGTPSQRAARAGPPPTRNPETPHAKQNRPAPKVTPPSPLMATRRRNQKTPNPTRKPPGRHPLKPKQFCKAHVARHNPPYP